MTAKAVSESTWLRAQIAELRDRLRELEPIHPSEEQVLKARTAKARGSTYAEYARRERINYKALLRAVHDVDERDRTEADLNGLGLNPHRTESES